MNIINTSFPPENQRPLVIEKYRVFLEIQDMSAFSLQA